MNVPLCFQHISLLRNRFLYNDLSKNIFLGSEKDFLCAEVCITDINELRLNSFDDDVTCYYLRGAILDRYNIPLTTFKHWQRNYANGVKNRDTSKGGRPLDIPLAYGLMARNALLDAESAVHPLFEDETIQLFRKLKLESKRNRFRSPDRLTLDLYNTSIDDRTIKSTKKRHRIADRAFQDLTPARLEALSNARVAFVTMCFVWILTRHIPAVHKWNADCTTFECKPNSHGRLVCVVRDVGEMHQVMFILLT